MADFWVSQQRHWCKYCKKFIANNKPSIQNHENAKAHKDNVDRFLRGVYKRGQEEKEQAESVRRELARIERAAEQTYAARDISSAGSPSSGSAAKTAYPRPSYLRSAEPSSSSKASSSLPPPRSTTTFAPPPPPPPAEHEHQHEGPQLMGREEWAVPAAVAAPGEWEVVTKKKDPEAEDEDASTANKRKYTTHDDKPEFEEPEAEDQEDLRNFKIKEKEYPTDTHHHEEDKDASQGGAVFKKRKVGKKNIRKRE